MSDMPPEVRILPMNLRREFPKLKSIEDLQRKFFLDELPFREGGYYFYRKKGLRAERGTLVLFQCEGRIIASAVFKRCEQFEKANEDGFHGKLYFDAKSIRVFDPVGSDVLKEIWPKEFKGLRQTMQKLDPNGYRAFERKLTRIRTPKASLYPDELPESRDYREGAVARVLVNKYERDPDARDACLARHGTRCKVCNLQFGERYGDIGEGFIHVHHVKPLGTVRGEYQIKPEADLIPVCPNCHAMLHTSEPPLSVDELKAKLRSL